MKVKHYLFDWGDTLMVDLPNQTGPMCDWPNVEAVLGAKECLQRLTQHTQCHLATNAEDSTENQIRFALQRAGLSDFITHVFCRENLGVGKADPDYYKQIVNKLNVSPQQVTMVGDSLERDVEQALKSGLQAIWLNAGNVKVENDIRAINDFESLI